MLFADARASPRSSGKTLQLAVKDDKLRAVWSLVLECCREMAAAGGGGDASSDSDDSDAAPRRAASDTDSLTSLSSGPLSDEE